MTRPALLLFGLLIVLFVNTPESFSQSTTDAPPCVPAPPNLQTYATALNRFWGTHANLLQCDGNRVVFGSSAKLGTVFFVPLQLEKLRFDGSGAVYILAHEWGHEVQFQRLSLRGGGVFGRDHE